LGNQANPKNILSLKLYFLRGYAVKAPKNLNGTVKTNRMKAFLTISAFICFKIIAAPKVPNKNGFNTFQNLFKYNYGL